jgi:hypothetical protein
MVVSPTVGLWSAPPRRGAGAWRAQPLRHVVLRQGGAEQPLETTVGCHLRLTRVAGPEMLSHLVGLRG